MYSGMSSGVARQKFSASAHMHHAFCVLITEFSMSLEVVMLAVLVASLNGYLSRFPSAVTLTLFLSFFEGGNPPQFVHMCRLGPLGCS